MLETLKEVFKAHRNAKLSVPMASYLKDNFEFLGLKNPVRTEIQKPFLLEAKQLSEKEMLAFCHQLFAQKEREYHYLACDILKKYFKKPSKNSLDDIYKLITTNSWWDSVDTLAVYPLGNLLRAHPELIAEMDKWIKDNNFWVRRSALLFQLKYKENTNSEKLFEYCLLCAHEKEFFIRKAIGWVLREYSKTNPKAVFDFVEQHKAILSGLSQREALRLIN